MPYLLVKQRFSDYTQWRTAFDSLDGQRTALGLDLVTVTRNMADPAEAVVLFRFDDMDQVRRHFPSPELEEAHRRGGVIEGSTQVTFLREAEAA
ncbi:heme-degrading monooxygenase HmoA [Lipingzhangella halophila]|uniref:Heme-degrading monooxygenase HmoA n=1 Tax=Lipingzhangella halophila TaxID=1783352 RepID=A0A7W7W078_9ACTN|nr:hypothetical protein [Lipingzhangella halophila]MBB4929622.1 heme-degrading monooxygenase HmoA [Lipingzhangella halophila]